MTGEAAAAVKGVIYYVHNFVASFVIKKCAADKKRATRKKTHGLCLKNAATQFYNNTEFQMNFILVLSKIGGEAIIAQSKNNIKRF